MPANRRDFLKGCCAGAAALGAGRSMAFFDPIIATGGKAAGNNVLVYLFLRGAIDGLHLVVPYSGPDRVSYDAKRGSANLAIPTNRLRPIAGTDFAWHPRAGGGVGDAVGSTPKWLQKLYNANRLAVVHATGMATPNRSHFESQAMMEMGTPGSTGSSSGWLARYLSVASGLPASLITPAIGFSGNLQTSLIGLDAAVSIPDGQSFRVDGFHWGWNESDSGIVGHQGASTKLFPLWNGGTELELAGRNATEALAYMREIDFGLHHAVDNPDGYLPGAGAVYPNSGLGTQLRNLAQLVKLDTGIVAAAVDYGFWDTHEGQGMPDPGNVNQYDWFGNLTEGLGAALDAFYTDLNATAGLMNRVTVVIQSEFGRRVAPNESGGTDHGYGNLMMALGNRVRGGQLHGTFPGLDDASLYEGQDVSVTTDFRQILSEALVDRMGLSPGSLGTVFPGFSYAPAASNVFDVG
jgi:uncharacterized protein (DUF1501 family)